MEKSRSNRAALVLAADVGINLVANLLAAAVIYLGGVLIGLFPREPTAIATAVVIILLAASWLPFIAYDFVNTKVRARLLALGQTLLAVAVVVSQSAEVDLKSVANHWIFWGLAPTIVGASWATKRWWTARQRKRSGNNKIRGLCWYDPTNNASQNPAIIDRSHSLPKTLARNL